MKLKKSWGMLLILCMICSLVACGNSSKPGISTGVSSENKNSEAGETNEDFVNIGHVVYDYNGNLSSCTQNTYDAEGNLVLEKISYGHRDDYIEIKYTKDGLKESYISYDENKAPTYGYAYSYEKDAEGRVVKRMETMLNETEPFATYVYSYREEGTLEKIQKFTPDGQLSEEELYDMNEKILESYSYNGGEVLGYSLYEYNDSGDLISYRYANQLEPEESIITYVNAYDEEGNLIFVSKYNEIGEVFQQENYAYAEPSDSYTTDDMEDKAKETLNRYYQTTACEEEHFQYIRELIESGKTAFTFGKYSARYMQLKSVELDEFAWDENGRYCDLNITYNTADGETTYKHRVYYIIDGMGKLNMTSCSVENLNSDCPVPQEESKLYCGDYYCVSGYTPYEIMYDESSFYYFYQKTENEMMQEYIGTVELRLGNEPNEYVLRSGHFTTDPVPEGNTYDYQLNICWSNGMVERYWVEALSGAERYVIRLTACDGSAPPTLAGRTLTYEDLPGYVKERLIQAD